MDKAKILELVNQATVALQKVESNMTEAVERSAPDVRAREIVASLFPSFRNDQLAPHAIKLGIAIVDDPTRQTFINVYNFFTMIGKHEALEVCFPIYWGKELEIPPMQVLANTFFEKVEGDT